MGPGSLLPGLEIGSFSLETPNMLNSFIFLQLSMSLRLTRKA